MKYGEAIKLLEDILKNHIHGVENLDASVAKMKLERKSRSFFRVLSQAVLSTQQMTVKRPKTIVNVRIVFMKIGVVDTIHERWNGEVLVQSKWMEPEFDGRNLDSHDIALKHCWSPTLTISNAIGELKCKTSLEIIYDRNGIAKISRKQLFTGQFFEFMELNSFPFDRQDLTITLVCDENTTEVDLQEDLLEPCGLNDTAFRSTKEWSLSRRVNVWKKTIAKKSNNMRMKHPSISVAVKVSRRPQFFLWNVVIILFAISCLAFSTFTVNLDKPESRMPLTFTLLLTTVTFKMVVNKNLPRISYLTYMDKYILGTMIILVTLCAWHAVVGSVIYNFKPVAATSATTISTTNSTNTTNACPKISARNATPTAKLIDKVVMVIFAGIYITFHLTFVVLIGCASSKTLKGQNEEHTDSEDESAT